MTSLQELHAWQAGSLGSIPPAIGNLRDLRVLDLRNCGLTGEVPAELGQLSQWVTLNLSTNPKLGGVLPVGLAKTQNLRFLAFDGTRNLRAP